MSELRFAIFGAGFWTRYQLPAWLELKGARCVAIYNRTRSKADAIAREFAIPSVYDNAEELLAREKPDFVDNITEVGGHKLLTLLALRHRIPVICQKPMAGTLRDAREMVAAARKAKTPFFIHENWRWQTPMRAMKRLLADGAIGTPFRASIAMISGMDVWANQPALRDLERFILTDMGSHILDVARVFFGEAHSLYCQTHRTLTPRVRGENVATVMMEMGDARTTVICEMAYAKTPLERECFPQTLMFVEGDKGSAELRNDYWVRVTTKSGTVCRRHVPPRYPWANPAYDLAHSSMVPCNANLLAALRGRGEAETSGEDNLKTMKLVFAAYESARTGKVIHP